MKKKPKRLTNVTPDEHPEDKLNRILSDRVADMVRDALLDGFKWGEVVAGVRQGLFHGKAEFYIEKGIGELQAERQAHAAAVEAMPQEVE